MTQKKEIVLICLDMTLGGAERVFSELANLWTERGIPVTVIQTKQNRTGNNYKLSEIINIVDISFVRGPFRRIKKIKEFVSIIKNYPKAVVISFLPTTTFLVGLSSFFINNRIVFAERNDPNRSPSDKIQRIFRDLFFELADICIFQTEEAKSHFSKNVRKKGFVLKNPINPLLPKPYNGIIRKVVIAAARLEKQKNLQMLIDAFSLFHEKHPDYSLEIFGKGPLETELNELIHTKGVQDSAHLMGFSDDIYSKMRDCAMYVSSSDYEGISNSMIEALGLGLPTICTDCPCGGARETITDGVNGLLVPVGDVQALYRAMCRIAEEPEFAEALSRNAVKIRDELAVDKIADQWLIVMGM